MTEIRSKNKQTNKQRQPKSQIKIFTVLWQKCDLKQTNKQQQQQKKYDHKMASPEKLHKCRYDFLAITWQYRPIMIIGAYVGVAQSQRLHTSASDLNLDYKGGGGLQYQSDLLGLFECTMSPLLSWHVPCDYNHNLGLCAFPSAWLNLYACHLLKIAIYCLLQFCYNAAIISVEE